MALHYYAVPTHDEYGQEILGGWVVASDRCLRDAKIILATRLAEARAKKLASSQNENLRGPPIVIPGWRPAGA